ncbi:hypothetical protein H8S20_13225 [Clostridium sp. NSJ-6]|uniref:Uncharacterized protein n=1 Tax=Clostridium hominis TaxID=2763036 RepID=A0ABR7DEI8_9CLOT|nr:hypothetical protein [Clostridium hominis]MBC5629845.1 hypothetical protein [Clostridium hominis]
MATFNLIQVILKFIVLGYGLKCVLEASKARENANFIKEFRYLLWAILILLSLKN